MEELYTLNKEQAKFIHELCKIGATYRATTNACLKSPLFKEYHDEIIEDGSYDGCHLKYAADKFYGFERGRHDEISGEAIAAFHATPEGRKATERFKAQLVKMKRRMRQGKI